MEILDLGGHGRIGPLDPPVSRALFLRTFLDATKAFYRIKYCKLFKLLLHCHHLLAPIIRVRVNLYTNNLVRVSLCGVVSDYFVV